MTKRPIGLEYPCLVPQCTAMVDRPAKRCPVHKVWSNGPYSYDCIKCRRPIETGDLYRLLGGSAISPVHAPCVGNKGPRAKRKKLQQLDLF